MTWSRRTRPERSYGATRTSPTLFRRCAAAIGNLPGPAADAVIIISRWSCGSPRKVALRARGDHLLLLDYTTALARMLSKRFAEPPPRVSYAGAVFRRANQPWEPVERFEVGCERIHTDQTNRDEADVELARLLMAVPATLGLRAAILQIGSAALLRCPMEHEKLPQPLADAVTRSLLRPPHRVKEACHSYSASVGPRREVALEFTYRWLQALIAILCRPVETRADHL